MNAVKLRLLDPFKEDAIGLRTGSKKYFYYLQASTKLKLLTVKTSAIKKSLLTMLYNSDSFHVEFNQYIFIRSIPNRLNTDEIIQKLTFSKASYLVEIGSGLFFIGQGCIIRIYPEIKVLLWTEFVGSIKDDVKVVYTYSNTPAQKFRDLNPLVQHTHFSTFFEVQKKSVEFLSRSITNFGQVGRLQSRRLYYFPIVAYLPCRIYYSNSLKRYEKTLIAKVQEQHGSYNYEESDLDIFDELKLPKIEGDNSIAITQNVIKKYNEKKAIYAKINRDVVTESSPSLEGLL